MTKKTTQQTTQACVLDKDGNPLMPTKRLGKIYRLLKTKKAHIVAYNPFTIQLNYEPETHIIQPMTLGVDSGAIHSGYSVANEQREYYSSEVIARDDISKNLSNKVCIVKIDVLVKHVTVNLDLITVKIRKKAGFHLL